MRHRTDGRVHRAALVTGATSGIGAAFARTLPDSTDLLLTGRDRAALAEASETLARPGRTVTTIAADLTREADRKRLATAAEKLSVDLLVNNAGTGHLGAVLDQPAETEQAVIALNVVAMAGLTRALLPGMIARAQASGERAGVIIVSSSTALSPLPYMTTYAASKVFAQYYTEGLAEELRREPIDVLALLPGPTKTAFGARAGYSGRTVPGALEPEQVADQALAALGRRTVLITGRASRAALEPVLRPRRALAVGLGCLMRGIDRRYGGQATEPGG